MKYNFAKTADKFYKGSGKKHLIENSEKLSRKLSIFQQLKE